MAVPVVLPRHGGRGEQTGGERDAGSGNQAKKRAGGGEFHVSAGVFFWDSVNWGSCETDGSITAPWMGMDERLFIRFEET